MSTIVILAGGIGKRLWPLSSEALPKPFTPLITSTPLIVETYERLAQGFPHASIAVATSAPHHHAVAALLPGVRTFVEPVSRDTAASIAFVSLQLAREHPNEPVIFVPADHVVVDTYAFLACLKYALELVASTGKLIDIGVTPRYSATTLGYTHIGDIVPELSRDSMTVHRFLGQVEKPDFERAREFVASGDYLWHASYFAWTPQRWIEAFDRHAPELMRAVRVCHEAFERGDGATALECFSSIEPRSVDYAIAEHIDPNDVLIVRGTFGWSDVGSWNELYELQKSYLDESENLSRGRAVLHETAGTFVHNQTDRIVAVFGAHDLVVVVTDDAVLVCPRSRAHELKKLVDRL
ncbi:MAG: sugar phosphate nucleotidyltransferase [bacterium]|nr:sugar phosphate nucleotidyltransferase [bacterium]